MSQGLHPFMRNRVDHFCLEARIAFSSGFPLPAFAGTDPAGMTKEEATDALMLGAGRGYTLCCDGRAYAHKVDEVLHQGRLSFQVLSRGPGAGT